MSCPPLLLFFFNDTATTEIYTLSLHDALPISRTTLASPRLRQPTRDRLSPSVQPPAPQATAIEQRPALAAHTGRGRRPTVSHSAPPLSDCHTLSGLTARARLPWAPSTAVSTGGALMDSARPLASSTTRRCAPDARASSNDSWPSPAAANCNTSVGPRASGSSSAAIGRATKPRARSEETKTNSASL